MWLGIDFSGNDKMWSPGCGRSNVWIAAIEDKRRKPTMRALHPVQALEGNSHPFDRLAAYLSKADFAAAGIDAPFALPARHMPVGGHSELLKEIAKLPRDGRPFPRGAHLVDWAANQQPILTKKPFRETEQKWRARGINVRSSLWNGGRGGAPFAVANLSLLAAAGRPCYPWHPSGDGMMVEAFPTAQLKVWRLPYFGYDGAEGRSVRRKIVRALTERVYLSDDFLKLISRSADALDAVLCALIARAWSNKTLLDYGAPQFPEEGWIAVAGDYSPTASR
jgi:hypothetical protein